MKSYIGVAIASLTLGLTVSGVAKADHSEVFGGDAPQICRNVAMIDVRGASPFDGNMDGMTTIAEVAIANPLDNLSTLLGVVLAATELESDTVLNAISDPSSSLTVFAPTDDAFAAIPAEVVDGLIASGSLTSVLLYHVVGGEFDPRKGAYLRSLDTIAGQFVVAKRGRPTGNPTINQSNIGCTGVATDNGYVWLLDSVLFPQF